tara:strand:+ start:605 stop:1105 length:501 start_codon:yes stop_codon:yes gene_type:complete
MSEKLYCPHFLYDLAVGCVMYDFLTKQYSLEMVGKKYAEGLSEEYIEIPTEELTKPAEESIRFMAELKGAQFEAHERVNHFIYYILKHDGIKGPRKLKGLFGSAFDGTKEKKFSEDKFFKEFKAYCFALRAGSIPKAPSGWSLKNEKGLEFFEPLIKKDFGIEDLL